MLSSPLWSCWPSWPEPRPLVSTRRQDRLVVADHQSQARSRWHTPRTSQASAPATAGRADGLPSNRGQDSSKVQRTVLLSGPEERLEQPCREPAPPLAARGIGGSRRHRWTAEHPSQQQRDTECDKQHVSGIDPAAAACLSILFSPSQAPSQSPRVDRLLSPSPRAQLPLPLRRRSRWPLLPRPPR